MHVCTILKTTHKTPLEVPLWARRFWGTVPMFELPMHEPASPTSEGTCGPSPGWRPEPGMPEFGMPEPGLPEFGMPGMTGETER
ncbi:MAG: hypothetical protein RI963_2899 [Planctomycetota bacterium]